MAYLFKELQGILDAGEQCVQPAIPKFTVSATVKDCKLGDEVIIGGRITRLGKDLYTKGNYYVELDDSVGTISIYLLAQIYIDSADILKEGNILLVRGYVAQRITTKERYVVCCSLNEINLESEKKGSDTIDS